RFWHDLLNEAFPLGLFPRRPEQRGTARDRTFEPLEESGIRLDAGQQLRQRFGIADRKIARIIAPEQAKRTVDARRQYRNAGGHGLGYDVCSAAMRKTCSARKSPRLPAFLSPRPRATSCAC